jgi:hypothetical protein
MPYRDTAARDRGRKRPRERKVRGGFLACRRPTAEARDDHVRTEDEIMIRLDLIMIEGASTAT